MTDPRAVADFLSALTPSELDAFLSENVFGEPGAGERRLAADLFRTPDADAESSFTQRLFTPGKDQ